MANMEEVLYMIYEKQHEEESSFVSVDTLIGPRKHANPNGDKPRDCSSILSNQKYETIENKNGKMDIAMTITGFIPGPNTFLKN